MANRKAKHEFRFAATLERGFNIINLFTLTYSPSPPTPAHRVNTVNPDNPQIWVKKAIAFFTQMAEQTEQAHQEETRTGLSRLSQVRGILRELAEALV